MVAQYNLKKARLAFFLGQKFDINDRFPTMIDSHLPVFSDELILVPSETTGEDEKTAQSTTLPPPVCQVDKYAPHYGFGKGDDEMLVFLTRKPEENKYGSKKNESDQIITLLIFFPPKKSKFDFNLSHPIDHGSSRLIRSK